MKHWRSLSIAIGAALFLATTAIPAARAEEAKPAAAEPAAAAPAPQVDGMMKGMEGCPGSADGSCCGTCQQAKQDVAAKAEGGGCPCQQRARLAKQQAQKAQ